MKRRFTFLLTALLLLTGLAWGQTRAEEVYSTCLFGGNHGTNSNYTSTWTATNGNFSWTVENGNTNGTSWNYVKFGRKNTTSVGTVITSIAYSEAITKVDLTIDAITAAKINSIKLYSSSDSLSWNEVGEFGKATGVQTVSATTPTANLFYKIEFDCAAGSGNGLVSVSKVEYYHNASGTPTVATPTFSPAAGTYSEAQNVSIACTTDGATIYYTLDGTTPTVEATGIHGTQYTQAITISETTTVKAIAVKDGMTNSAVATATYTIQEMPTITTIDSLWIFAATVGSTQPTQVNANVTFNDWYVTGIKSSQVCVSDGQYGFVIYQSSHGFAIGDKLSGTVACKVLMYQNHYAEVMGVKASDLTVVSGQDVPEMSTTIAALEVRNYGTAIDLGTCSYNGSKFYDAAGDSIALYNNFNVNPSPIDSLEAGKQYNVKGVSIIYWQSNNQIQQIAPRSADDFEEVTAPMETVATPTFTLAEGTYTSAQNVAIHCETQGATIYYTIDGTAPINSEGPTGIEYNDSITISETTTLKAVAVRDGMNPSEIATAVYTIETPTGSDFVRVTNLSEIGIGSKVVIAARFNATTSNQYYAMTAQASGKPTGVPFTSFTGSEIESLPSTLADDSTMYWTVNIEGGNYTFTNAAGNVLGYSSSTNFATGGNNTGWTIVTDTAASNAMVPDYVGFVITNANNNIRAIALNSSHNFGPYHTQNMSGTSAGNYNYMLDIFATEGQTPAPTYYTINVADSIANGTVSADTTQAIEGTIIHVTATPANDNYELASLTYTYTGVATPIDIMETKQFTMPAADVIINGSFSLKPTVATPTFTPEQGIYSEAQTVSIACETQGATIYYTIDGTTPSVTVAGINGTQYTQPLIIGDSTTVKAIAVKEGMINSEVATATYVIEIPSLVFNKLYYHTDVTEDGIYMIVDVNGGFALNNNGGTTAAPKAVPVTIENDAIIGNIPDSLQWQFTAVTGGYRINPLNDSINYLYTTNTNNGVRVGTNTNNVWELNITDTTNYHGFKNVSLSTKRYLGVYNNQDWRAYTSINNNIKNTQIEIFVLGPAPVHTFYPVNVATITNGTVTVSDTLAEAGTVITVTAEPASGYELATLTYSVTGAAPVAIDQTSMQFTMPAAPVTVSATFTELAHVANPTFTPAAGSYIIAQNVVLTCVTDSATIYYTTDGTDPTTASTVYTEPFEVSATTTVKAMAAKAGMNNSDVVSAVYTIIEPMTIANARALANNEYALVQGVVTFIDGRNVYVQDSTAGIDLFLNNNTVPSTLAIGDMVLGYGKKTVYNGLTELTSIAGNNANQFIVLSTGNELPLAVKTIAEILEDHAGDKMLQSTRVQIVNATIGAINNANNTPITQDESTINIYKLPVVEGLEENDFVNVIGVIGCYNNPQLRVKDAADVTFTHPAGITVNPASLSGFNYVYEEGPSTAKSFVISARSLTAATHIVAPESYELSSFPGEAFHPQDHVTINTYTGAYSYTIQVRLKAGLEIGTYDESITIYEDEVDTLYIALSGSVTAQPQPTMDYVRVNDLSQITNGAKVIFAARYNETANEYFAMTAQTSGKPEGVLFTSETNATAEILPSEITDAEDTYYWTVTTDGTNYTFTNASGNVLGYTSSTNFATGGDNVNWTITAGTSEATAMVPNYSAYNIINGNITNRAFALNSNHNFGPYHTQNIAADNYNFFIDIFVSGEAGTPVCAAPTFEPEGGTYFEAQTVTISCTTEDATIYYTVDGSDPTPNSLVYTEPITVAENMTLKAYAVKEGYDDSSIAEAEYTVILGAVTIFSQDWEGEMNGWTFVTVEGIKPWSIQSYSGNHYANANGYNGGANEQWCISPAFNLDMYENESLSFRNAMKFTGPDMEVFFSNNYDGEDPTTATWTALEYTMSAGNYEWTESGAIDLADFTGTNCYIGFKYTSTETEAASWEIDDILLIGFTSDPVLTVTPLSLNFTYVEGNGPSTEQSFLVTGFNLTENVVITIEGEDFEMSDETGEDFDPMDEYEIEPIEGIIEEVIYVRMAEGLEMGDYTASITVASELDDITVELNGTVAEPIPSGDWNKISSLADLHDGDQVIIAARYDATVGDGYYAMTAGVSGKPDGVLFTSVNENGIEMLPEAIANDAATFLWTVTVNDTVITLTNANGDLLGYSSSTNFAANTSTDWSISQATAGDNAMVPNHTGFVITNVETNNRCIVMNDNYKFGAYHTNNINNGSYNFFLDLFVLGGSATQTVATPVFSVASGTYYEEFDVEITCATEGATIYYTNDGTEPTAESTVYEGAIHVDADMTLKAIAMMEGYENSGVATVTYTVITGQTVILNQDWEGEMNGWTFVTVEGNKPWTIASYGGNHYANANGYNDDIDNEQWCISPAFDLTYFTDVVLTFRNAMKFTGPDMQLFFSTDYDGTSTSAANWTELDFVKSEGNYTWTESGEISLDGLRGSSNCHIAFLYTSTLEDGAAAWEVDDILVVGTAYDAVEETTLTDFNFWNSDNEIFIDNQTNGNVQMVVFNVMGQQVMSKTISAGSVRFSHNLATGLYVVALQNSKGRMAVKMIVR